MREFFAVGMLVNASVLPMNTVDRPVWARYQLLSTPSTPQGDWRDLKQSFQATLRDLRVLAASSIHSAARHAGARSCWRLASYSGGLLWW